MLFKMTTTDRLGRRKLLAVLGYSLCALTKRVFGVAVTPFEVPATRFVDRVGRGIRVPPPQRLFSRQPIGLFPPRFMRSGACQSGC